MSDRRPIPWTVVIASNVIVAALVAAALTWPRGGADGADGVDSADHGDGAGALAGAEGDGAATGGGAHGDDNEDDNEDDNDDDDDASATSAAATAAEADANATASATDLADEATESAPPLAIVTEPRALRVWHNTEMRVRAVPAADGSGGFVRYVWHFEDGSRPVEGVEATHVFPESVTDRHVTLEGYRRDGSRLVVSRRVPIERLEVVPIDGPEAAPPALPKARGPRLLLVGPGDEDAVTRLMDRLEGAGVVAVVAIGDGPFGAVVRRRAGQLLPGAAVIALDIALATDAEVPPEGEGAALIGAGAAKPIPLADGGEAAPQGVGAWVIGDVAIVAVDTRPMVIDEARLGALRTALQRASAWPATLLLSARPLSGLVDDETVADRAYRIYEHALRERVSAVVSAASGVAYDARYGGLQAVAAGRLAPAGCARLRGSDACQPGSATLVELGGHGRLRVFHLVAPGFAATLGDDELPATVGRYRR